MIHTCVYSQLLVSSQVHPTSQHTVDDKRFIQMLRISGNFSMKCAYCFADGNCNYAHLVVVWLPCSSRLDKCRHRTQIAASTTSLQPPVLLVDSTPTNLLPLPPILCFCPYSLAPTFTLQTMKEKKKRTRCLLLKTAADYSAWRFPRLSCSVLLLLSSS